MRNPASWARIFFTRRAGFSSRTQILIRRGLSRRKRVMTREGSNVFGILLVLPGVTAFLPFEIHLVLFHVSLEDVVGAHAEHLREADETMKEIEHFDAGVLRVELLVFGPPFPGNAVGQFCD